MNMKKQLNSYPTKYPQGFTSQEIDDFLQEYYPEIARETFNVNMGVNTAMVINGEVVHYHIDIDTCIKKCLGLQTTYWD